MGGIIMTKRVSICTVVLMCIALLVPISAQATGTTTYDLDQLGMSIDIPDDYDVFTRDTPADDPAYAWYGFTKESFDSLLEERNIYLNAIPPNSSREIVVTMIESTIQSFHLMSDTTLSFLASTWTDVYEDSGVTCLKYEIYQHQQVKFVKIYISQEDDGQPVYGLQYYTVCNGQAINITMHSYSGELTQADEDSLQEIVDSANFWNAEPIPETDITTEPFMYVDSKTGVSFTVPANWQEKALFEERTAIDAKFASTQEEGLLIFYGSADFWETIPESERAGLSRTDIDSLAFLEVDSVELARSWGVEGAEVSQKEYNGKTYLMMDGILSGQAYEQTVSIPMIIALRMENGYLCHFQFAGTADSPYFQDFTQLLGSVQYPEVPSGYGTESTHYSTYRPSVGASIATVIITSFLLTVAVYSLPIIIYRYGIVKRPVEHKKAMRIVILYGIAAFFIISAIIFSIDGRGATGGAIFLWSWINYRVLIGGKPSAQDLPVQEAASSNNSPQEIIPPTSPEPALPDGQIHQTGISVLTEPEMSTSLDPSKSENDARPKILFCHKCGSRLIFRGTHCFRCGAKIPDETEM